jgi:hypothetical protein
MDRKANDHWKRLRTRVARITMGMTPLLLALVAAPAQAQDERSMPLTAGQAGGFFPFSTPNNGNDTLESVLKGEGLRLFDFELRGGKTAGVFISNSAGTGMAKNWWMAAGSGIDPAIKKYNARVLDVEIAGDGTVYALLVPNTGASAKAWGWLIHVTGDQITAHLQKYGGRIIDIERYRLGSQWRYSVVMIANTGADARAWWWYPNRTADEVVALLKQNKARLTDVESHPDGRFTVLMEKQTVPSWWIFGVTVAQIEEFCKKNKARVIDLAEYAPKEGTYSAVMIPLKQ